MANVEATRQVNHTFYKEIISSNGKTISVNIQFELPSYHSPIELSQKLLSTVTIPVELQRVFEKCLTKIIEDKIKEYLMVNKPVKLFAVTESTRNKWCTETLDLQRLPDEQEQFRIIFSRLVHSLAREPILTLEYSYVSAMLSITKERDSQLSELSLVQTQEMKEAMEGLSSGLTEADITALANKHLNQHGFETCKWRSVISGLHEAQKAEYRKWILSLADHNCNTPLTSPIASPLKTNVFFGDGQVVQFQESFTIHLGSQMKHMYNIRLMAADPLDLCRLRFDDYGVLYSSQPQRLQTALGLYSNDLCGIVLIADCHFGDFSGVTRDLLKVCELQTELHFDSMENQLDKIRASIKDVVDWRKYNSNEINNILTATEQMSRKIGTKYLQPGDVYITKHSNLSEVHVVYHMICDDSVLSNDISSRHSAILGLRNIIKSCCLSDVTTLTIPLLLTLDDPEILTLPWCTKRAELVFKCVKGFMIEMSTWGGSELKTVQFLVPKGISEEIFSAIATMLPTIFRTSNPLVLTDNAKRK